MVETLSKNITRQGLTATTLNYLRVSSTVTNIEPLDSEPVSGSGPGAGQGGSTPLDPESLPLPSAHTLTGQSMTQPGPGGSMPDNMDFGADNFQF